MYYMYYMYYTYYILVLNQVTKDAANLLLLEENCIIQMYLHVYIYGFLQKQILPLHCLNIADTA